MVACVRNGSVCDSFCGWFFGIWLGLDVAISLLRLWRGICVPHVLSIQSRGQRGDACHYKYCRQLPLSGLGNLLIESAGESDSSNQLGKTFFNPSRSFRTAVDVACERPLRVFCSETDSVVLSGRSPRLERLVRSSWSQPSRDAAPMNREGGTRG